MKISEELKTELFKKYGKTLKKDEILFKEKDTADEMYIILSGKIKITKIYHGDTEDIEKLLVIYSEGDFFGEMSLLNNEKRAASAIVEEEAEVITINKSTFNAMIRNNAEFSMKILSSLSNRIRNMNKQIEELIVNDKKARILSEILSDCNDNDTFVVKIDNLKKRLVENFGIDEADIKRIISKMAMNNFIEIKDGVISLKEKKLLEKIVHFIYEI